MSYVRVLMVLDYRLVKVNWGDIIIAFVFSILGFCNIENRYCISTRLY